MFKWKVTKVTEVTTFKHNNLTRLHLGLHSKGRGYVAQISPAVQRKFRSYRGYKSYRIYVKRKAARFLQTVQFWANTLSIRCMTIGSIGNPQTGNISTAIQEIVSKEQTPSPSSRESSTRRQVDHRVLSARCLNQVLAIGRVIWYTVCSECATLRSCDTTCRMLACGQLGSGSLVSAGRQATVPESPTTRRCIACRRAARHLGTHLPCGRQDRNQARSSQDRTSRPCCRHARPPLPHDSLPHQALIGTVFATRARGRALQVVCSETRLDVGPTNPILSRKNSCCVKFKTTVSLCCLAYRMA